jgi:hypothetical protein
MSAHSRPQVDAARRGETLRKWFCILAFVIVVSPVVAQESAPKGDDLNADVNSSRDNICGPRSVQYLLRYYTGSSPELVSLVRQLQWPDIRAGASLADIQRVLEAQGIPTKPIKIGPNRLPSCQHPSVLHLRCDTSPVVGHYVVLLPGSSSFWARIWDRDGEKRVPTCDLADRCSGAVLVTSPPGTEIIGVPSAFLTADAIVRRCGILCIAILVPLIAAACAKTREKTQGLHVVCENVVPIGIRNT